MSYRVSDAGALLADIREQARKALAERLLGYAHPDVRSQLIAGVTSHTKGLTDAQVIMWHAMLDRTAPSRVAPETAGQT